MPNYYNNIVQLNVSQTVAPEPNLLQSKAAIVSMGGSDVPVGTVQYISNSGQIDDYIEAPYDISAISWAAGVVTIAFTNPHGIPVGLTTPVKVSGVTPTGYNGTFTATSFNSTTLNYALAANPGASSVLGTALIGPQLYLMAADATWWGQGDNQTGYYIFESGTADVGDCLDAVQTYLEANPQTIYNWGFLPGVDADSSAYIAFALLHNALTSIIKFYLPVSSSTYATYATEDTLRNTFVMIQSPDANVSTELDITSFMQYITGFNPTTTNKLPPSQYTYLDAVTAYKPLPQSLVDAFMDGNINFVTTGAEGGISNTILVPGKNLDGTPANVGYSIDWIQINLNTDLANAVINGSNNPISPLYYNQDGINFLQQVAAITADRAIATGLALGRVIVTSLTSSDFARNLSLGLYRGNFVINAVPFSEYTALNPSDYANGLYGGFAASYVPQYGFERIVFNLNVTQFA
jgi:hypothetical protein